MNILLGILLCLLFGLIPTAIYAWFVNWLDRYEKEPWWLLATAFAWGAIPAIIMALIAQIVLDIPTTWVLSGEGLAYEIVGGSVWAPLTEEFAKGLGLVLILVLARREVTPEVYQMITSWGRWQGSRWEALLRGDLAEWRRLGHLRHTAAELAFGKQRLARLGQDGATQREIERYRQYLVELGATPQ